MNPTSNDELALRFAELERRVDAATRRARRAVVVAVLAIAGATAWVALPNARAQFGLTLTNLDARLKLVEAKTKPITLVGTDLLRISNVNVQIVDGSDSTLSDSGLGNLIIGYNALREYGTNARGGSHNLILGDFNNYKSSGGLVAGRYSEISGRYATVSGGEANTASGFAASVSGGDYNTARGYSASVSGGAGNTASGSNASVSGGEVNTARGYSASVSGGETNLADGDFASVSGGFERSAPDQYNWAGGSYFSAK